MRRRRAMVIALGIVAALIAVGVAVTDPFSDVPDMSPRAMVGPTVRASGLEMSLRLPRGPYFLGELLPVEIWLKNHSRRAITLQGSSPSPNPCGSALGVITTGGGPPRFLLNEPAAISCPVPGTLPLQPDRTLSMQQWLPLTDSGRVTVVAQTMFLRVTPVAGGGTSITSAPNPLGRWPSITIAVAPQAPPGRTLSFVHLGPALFVAAPLRVRRHLLYLYGVSCKAGPGRFPATFISGTSGWQQIPSGVVYDPGCPGRNERWSVAVSAPGYAISEATFDGRGEGKL